MTVQEQDIELLELEIENFKSYSKATLTIGNKGLALVEGENVDWSAADSNGVGKTTTADAIVWAIYGKTLPKKDGTEGFKGDTIVNNIVQKNCHVGLKLKIGGDTCRIDRYRKHEKHANKCFFQVGKARVEGSDADSLQEKIEQAIGLDYRAFTTAVVVKGFPFTGSSDGEQKKILDKILGMEWLQEVREGASKKVTALTREREDLQRKINVKKERLTESRDYLGELQEKEDNFDKDKKSRRKDLKEELTEVKERLDKLSTEEVEGKLQKVQENIEERVSAIENEDEVRRLLEHARNAKEEAIRDYDKTCVLVGHEEDRIIKLGNARGVCTECETKIDPRHIRDTIEKHQEVLKELLGQQESQEKLVETLKTKVQAYKEELDSLQDCKRELDSLRNRERALKSEADTIKQKIDNLKASAKSIQKQIDSVDDETSPYAELISTEKGKQTKLREDIADMTLDDEELHVDLKDWEYLEAAFGNGGVRSFILDDVVDDLNVTVKGYARALTDGKIRVKFETHGDTKKGESREKFGIKVNNLLGADSNYHQNSDGEMSRIDACVMLSLNYLSRTRQNRRLRFMFLDEFLDGLDKTGRDRVIRLLKDIAKECRIFVVTHSLDLKPKFDEVIKVRKEGGFATIIT